MEEEIKVSQLPVATQINNEDLLMIIQNNTNKKVSASEISNIPDINNQSVVVSPTEPSGSNRRKVWLRHTDNLFVNYTKIENANINSSGTIISDASFDLYYIPCKSSTTYIIKYGNIAENKIVMSSYENIPAVGSTGNSRLVATGQTTYTTRSNDNYLVVRDAKNLENITAGIFITEEALYVSDKEYILNNNVYETFEPQNEIYSTGEVRIGTFLGKPLYRKVYNFGALPNNTSKSVALNISNLNEITSIRGICKNPNADFVTPIPIVFADGTNQLQVYVQSGQLSVYTSADRSSYTQSYIILEYTKTTDV